MKVELRHWDQSFVDELVRLANNEKLSARLRDSFPFPYGKKDGEDWIRVNTGTNPQTQFAIFANDQFAGGAGIILNTDIHKKSAEIGYWLGEPFWGKGIGTLAIGILVKYIFAHLDIVRIYAEVFSNNPASMRALEKNGFVLEAVLKKAIFKNSQLMDGYLWVKLRS